MNYLYPLSSWLVGEAAPFKLRHGMHRKGAAAHDLHIPPMLISKNIADSITMKLVSGHSVWLEIVWMIVPTKTAQYNLRTTTANHA
eukprot:6896029-Ditylum_brightwellii.AAC.1